MSVRHSAARAALLLAALFAPVTALAADLTPAITQAQQKVSSSVSRWEAARQKLEEARSRAAVLEHRIAALKRLRANGATSGEAELQNLLKESVTTESTLRAANKAVDSLASEVRRSVAEAYAAIDARVKTQLVPRAYQGDKAAAAEAQRLLALRAELGRVPARLREPTAAPQTFAHYRVTIDPLDGPKELGEKADFVEDTRDRTRNKRAQLEKLIREAREEASVRRATKAFETDTRIFDEEGRRERVARSSGNTLAARSNEKNSETPQATFNPAGRQEQSPPPQPQDDPDNSFTDAPAEVLTGVTGDSTEGGGDPGVTPPPTFEPAQIQKLDPNVLLNLRVDALDGSAASLAQLEAYAAELAKLDQFLAQQADQLRKRAEQLKADEKKATGN